MANIESRINTLEIQSFYTRFGYKYDPEYFSEPQKTINKYAELANMYLFQADSLRRQHKLPRKFRHIVSSESSRNFFTLGPDGPVWIGFSEKFPGYRPKNFDLLSSGDITAMIFGGKILWTTSDLDNRAIFIEISKYFPDYKLEDIKDLYTKETV